MIFSIFVILYLIGFVIYAFKTCWVVLYWIVVEVFMLPILSLIAGCPFAYDLAELAAETVIWGKYYWGGLFVWEYVKNRQYDRTVFALFKVMGIFMVYIISSKFFSSGTLATVSTTISDLIFQILPFLFLLMRPEAMPSNSVVVKWLKYIIVIESILCLLNYYGIYLFIPHYFPTFVEVPSGTYETFIVHISGTFARYNAFANFFATLYLIICCQYFSQKQVQTEKFYIISLFFGVIILSTGAKVSLVLCLFVFLYVVFKYTKTKILLLIPTLLIALLFLFFKSFDNVSEVEAESGAERQLYGLASFLNSSKDEDASTLSLSTYLVDNYFFNSPFFGNNLAYKGEMAYGNYRDHTLPLFFADARMAYILVESGVVGLFLYLLCFYVLFKTFKRFVGPKEKWKFKLCFMYFFLLTITESGFFDGVSFPLLALLFTFIRRNNMDFRIGRFPYAKLNS